MWVQYNYKRPYMWTREAQESLSESVKKDRLWGWKRARSKERRQLPEAGQGILTFSPRASRNKQKWPWQRLILAQWGSVLASHGCYDKVPPAQWLKTAEMYFFIVSIVLKGRGPTGGTRGRAYPALPASGGCKHSLAGGPILPIPASMVTLSSCLCVTFLCLSVRTTLAMAFRIHPDNPE